MAIFNDLPTASDISKLTVTQIRLLLPSDIALLPADFFSLLSQQQLQALSPAQIAIMPQSVSFNALTTRQISYFSPVQLNSMRSDQISSIASPVVSVMSKCTLSEIWESPWSFRATICAIHSPGISLSL